MNSNEPLTLFVSQFVEELVLSGVHDAVISPGSRSTPLAVLLQDHADMKTYIQIDERSAGFFALGIAKAKQKPVVLVCTSGTAAANYYPAVVEAFLSRIPLIILTADRPHELRDVGAPQAINQNNMYGEYVKWFTDAALPEADPGMLHYVRTLAGRAAGHALSMPMGPVHLNFPFREPLMPDLNHPLLWAKKERTRPKVSVPSSRAVLSEQQYKELAHTLNTYQKGIIVCGELNDTKAVQGLIELSEQLGFPILADPLSQLRAGSHRKDLVVEHYDSFLKDEEIAELIKPEIVIRFGSMPVSKPLFLLLKNDPSIYQIVVDSSGGWRDPTLHSAEMIHCNEAEFCQSIMLHARRKENVCWAEKWLNINRHYAVLLNKIEDFDGELFEGKLYMELQSMLPQTCTLFVGNSMPIRDIDTFFSKTDKEIKIYANRGANGIDGVVSTALGMSAAIKDPVFLLLGDLSFYHDLNGLLAANLQKLSLTVIVINNNGGGIFSFLPQSQEEKHFEALFGTPTNLDFSKAAQLYGAQYQLAQSWKQFYSAFEELSSVSGLKILEVRTNRHTRVEMHRNLLKSVSQEIKEKLK
ncbi:2-succinyl-5-enolpyruvyl-6-hydroxy-3-cyclohexene-1-carboxylic-acid synthase [Bacillus lacus]|uniref:2-succinyl-5-enolpyruvyl-6-hydroxy-3-cyclohexene-1-carboxylate synthase n=2 Tax=Metabacillus lacus TaxID=1983721 RepID=A0A7X2IZ99_9BACI|nr:2-succinyl-5-enolpyruvyl-6-hydroxy-3-cyclohexene-1-carboxylic-acid synthase [Metabacillus lacus]MRX72430.1 2-succinyl-5-enolpyruvyl-6-hydroxy-3-cyclohexene-1-carboxylic-acid synthase [Metabacillus lacus]